MIKRLFDILVSFGGLCFLAPFFCVIAIWIKMDSPGSIFYRQIRVGRYGRNFKIHKFRTMHIDADKLSKLTVGDDSRITRPGQLLRKYKIDELPQLIDVLYGTMSIVGPRPEVPEFMDYYPDVTLRKVLSIRPGITDLASIEMMDENEILAKYADPRKAYLDLILPIKQKYYIDYANNNSFFGDIKIIFLTILKILGPR